MRIRVLQTLSSRIIVGFTVLILTFGAVSALTVYNVGLLGREIRVMRIGYSELALISKDLSEKQTDLRQYLLQDLTGESSEARVRGRMARFRKARDLLLAEAEAVVAGLDDLPPAHHRTMHRAQQRIDHIRDEVALLEPLYAELLEAPPLDRNVVPGVEPNHAHIEANELLKRLQRSEGLLQGKVVDFARDQRTRLKNTARTLESNGRTIRSWTLLLGAIAVIVGLLITVWGAFTLRPLGRLRDAAQRIASGDYAGLIDETGPAEIADLAREFNVMGRAIDERERELVRSERLVAVGKMAAMITHEVRNPLSSIGLNTELLEEELQALPPAQAAEASSLCRAITTEIDRLTGITEEYLQFARLPKPKLAHESLSRLVRDLTDFEREQLALRGVTLEVDLDETLPLIMLDEGQIRQSLLNLLRNAADAVEEVGGGTVSISTAVAGAMAEVRVADQGTGISDELVSKLFEPFFSTKDGGTGLGLALTQQIIREHGGDIRVDSRPGHGAVFVVTLPLIT